jgi:uncharacterized protein YndB with AHSA1/START domain
MIDFTLTRTSTAPIETVFDAMTDNRGIADYVWACRRSTLNREGTPAPNGVGAIRRLGGDRTPIRRGDHRVRATHPLRVQDALRRTDPESHWHDPAAGPRSAGIYGQR